MKKAGYADSDLERLDAIIEEITIDAYGDDEKLWAFRQAFDDDVLVPADAFVIGEPVVVDEIDYDGNERRGLTARCRREDGSEHLVAVSEVVFPAGTAGARYVAAYRRWLGLDPRLAESQSSPRRQRRHKVENGDLDLDRPVELVVISVKKRAARCRLLKSERVITLRAKGFWSTAPGEIVTVRPRKQWRYAGHPYLSGEIESGRIDAPALGLVPLRLEERGLWDPGEILWGEEDDPAGQWAGPIIARGPRPAFELKETVPATSPDDPLADPVLEAIELKEVGDYGGARAILEQLCESDLRCLEAHAHLGAMSFRHSPRQAARHFEVGLRIGELSLGNDFDGVLPWVWCGNQPFLRCLHGYALCLWRLDQTGDAERLFERLLWLDPADTLDARFLLDDIRAGMTWDEGRDDTEHEPEIESEWD